MNKKLTTPFSISYVRERRFILNEIMWYFGRRFFVRALPRNPRGGFGHIKNAEKGGEINKKCRKTRAKTGKNRYCAQIKFSAGSFYAQQFQGKNYG